MIISWRIELLGGLCARRLDEPSLQNAASVLPLDHFRSRGEGALLALLAYFPRPHAREFLSELLWPRHDPRLSRNHLRVVLSTLRRCLVEWDEAAADFLVIDRASIGLNHNRVTTDVAEFENALQQASQTANRDEQREHLARGVEVYRGALLPGFYESWVMPEAHRLEELYFGALRQLVAGCEAEGDVERALHYARRGASVDALREDVGRDLMRLYAATGQCALALRHYHDLERALRHSLNVTPDPQTRELFAHLEREARGGFHSAKTLIATDGAEQPRRPLVAALAVDAPHLPAQWTRFFGRETEIAAVRSWLQNGIRLVTLTGTGGSGKTRLALEIARTLADESCHSLWFVPLADVSDAALIASEIVGAMRLPPIPQLTPHAQLLQSLNQRAQPLLVLDNFEQLLPAGAAIVHELLARVPQLKLIVTSRQELQIAGEHPFAVPPLPVPATGLTPEELARVESVRLFHDRARSARPSFRVTKSNAAALAQLCARLEGLPLAIELCAARAGAFPPAQMLKRLERRFDFLTQAPQGSTYRHSTLRAALEWSYELLWPELQSFFAALGVFRGGCTAAAAAAIASEPHAAHLLHQLRLVSLAQSTEVDGETRFFLLESVREFAREKLLPAQKTDLRRRHAEYFAALAQSAEPHLSGPQQRQWLDRLDIETDNARAALDWSEVHVPALHLNMTCASGRFWLVRGYYAEGRSRIETAMHSIQVADSESAEANAGLSLKLLGIAADLAWYNGDFAESLSLSERKLSLSQASGDGPGVAQALHVLAYAMAQMGDFAAARPLFDQSLDLSRQAHDDALRCEVLLGAISEASAVGDFERARVLGDEGIALARRQGDTRLTAQIINIVGFAACLEGDLQRARPLLEESLELCEAVGEKWHTNRAWWTLGHLARLEGDFANARAHFDRALTELREWCCLWPLPYHLEPRAYIDIAEGRYQRAARLLGAAQALRETMRHALHPSLRPEYERQLAALHQNFDAALLEAAWDAGRALNLEGMTALALDEF